MKPSTNVSKPWGGSSPCKIRRHSRARKAILTVDGVGRALWAILFFKIECFCFTEEKLGPGESAKMPLVLYLDEQMLKDENARMFREVTLSYTFFRQKDLSTEEIDAARDLKAGSEATDARLDGARSAEFENDAPRR